MVASVDTITQVIQVVRKHVSDETMQVIIQELLQVPGNKSFQDTVQRMADLTKSVTE